MLEYGAPAMINRIKPESRPPFRCTGPDAMIGLPTTGALAPLASRLIPGNPAPREPSQ
jgi:hypothetical protein